MSSGILTRMASTQVCRQEMTSPVQSIVHISRRWSWYLLTPLMPALLAVIIGLVLLLAGLVFFNVAVLDVIGSLGYGLLLLLGFIVTAVTLLLLFALFLMPEWPCRRGERWVRCDRTIVQLRPSSARVCHPFPCSRFTLQSFTCWPAQLRRCPSMQPIRLSNWARSAMNLTGADRLGRSRDAGGTIGFNAWVVSRWIELVTAIVLAILLSTLCCLQTGLRPDGRWPMGCRWINAMRPGPSICGGCVC